ncbi:hypothetical protein QBC35DRAFT_551828, partial [Podospora australis]
RANRRLINASIYLSQYELQVVHIEGKRNYVPDALSRLRTLQDQPERSDDVPVLDDVWFIFAEARMDDELKRQFVEGYNTDKKYRAVIEDIKAKTVNEGTDTLSRPGLPFLLIEDLLYNIRTDGSRALCVPRTVLKTILATIHDEKHHFGTDRMLHDLKGLAIHHKTSEVKKYIKWCPTCRLNQTNRDLPNGNYQPIRPIDNLPMRVIAMDFITVEIALRYHIFEHPDQPWIKAIPALQWNLNSAHSSATGSSPHEQLYGFRLQGPLEVLTE